jgi:hypothetical protein
MQRSQNPSCLLLAPPSLVTLRQVYTLERAVRLLTARSPSLVVEVDGGECGECDAFSRRGGAGSNSWPACTGGTTRGHTRRSSRRATTTCARGRAGRSATATTGWCGCAPSTTRASTSRAWRCATASTRRWCVRARVAMATALMVPQSPTRRPDCRDRCLHVAPLLAAEVHKKADWRHLAEGVTTPPRNAS